MYKRRRCLDGSEGVRVLWVDVVMFGETVSAEIEIVADSAVVADEERREGSVTSITIERRVECKGLGIE